MIVGGASSQLLWLSNPYDSLLSLSSSSRPLVDNTLCFGLLCVVFVALFSLRFLRRNAAALETFAALEILLRLLAPSTQSAWPPVYAALAKRASRSKDKTIVLPLGTLVRDISAGTIELRDAIHDLPDLLCDSFSIYAWSIRLHVGLAMWSTVLMWLFKSQLPSLKFNAVTLLESSKTNAQAGGVALSVVSNSLGFQSSLGFLSSDISLTLDLVPPAHLEAFIRTLQLSLPENSTAIIEFTTIGARVKPWNKSFVLCVVPFLPRKYASRSSSITQERRISQTRDRTPATLLKSLHGIIEFLTSGSSPLTIASVQNVSQQYISRLDTLAKDMEQDDYIRKPFYEEGDMEGWRKERFVMSWEASLFAANFLTRWIVVVKK